MAGKSRSTPVPALIWKRIIALIIDLMIIDIFVLFPFGDIISSMVPGSLEALEIYSQIDQKTKSLIIIVSFIIGVLAVLYFSLMEWKLHQSIGKMVLRISVESEGKELRLWQCIARSLFLIPVFPFIIFWVADPVYMFFNDKNQRLLERWSRTRTEEVVL